MRILKTLGVKGLATALAFAMAPAAVPAGAPVIGAIVGGQAKADELVYVGEPRYYRGGGHRWGGWNGGRDWDRHSYRRHRNNDAAAAAIISGIVGLGIGAAVASQPRYYEPAPRYYEPAPRYYRPAPVYRSGPRYSSYAPEPWTREWYSYCSSRWRSFDPRSGTYQPYDGPRRFCQ